MKRLIYDKKKALRVPDGVHEISGKQLCAIAGIIHCGANKLKASLKALRILSHTSRLKFYFLPAELKLRAIEYVQWIFDVLNITDQLLPKYKNFYGPISELDNLKLAEFHFTEKYYKQLKSKEPGDALENLISVLYRVAKPGYDQQKDIDGDIRIKFSSNLCTWYVKQIKRWPPGVKFAILMYYDGCRAKIELDNNELFEGGDSEDDELGMYGIMRGLAGPKFGDLEKVEEMYLHTAFLELKLMKKEQEKLEAQYKKTA